MIKIGKINFVHSACFFSARRPESLHIFNMHKKNRLKLCIF